MKPIRFLLVLAVVAAGGCDLYKDDCQDVYYETGVPEILQRNPYSGQCESYGYGGGGYYSSCGDDTPQPAGADYAVPNWPQCESFCTGLPEDACKDTVGCQAAYLRGGECIGDCPDVYYGCWAIIGGGAIYGDDCESLDAGSCSTRDDCVRFHVHDDAISPYESDPEVGPFLSCGAEEPSNTCASIVDEQACLDADACIPVYQGNDCTCDGGDCTCQSFTFASCSDGDVCAFLDGKAFASVAELECGLTPDGPLPCRWSVSFADGRYDYHFSDVQQSGSFTCNGGTITGSGGVSGTYDFDTGTLLWDGVAYMQSP